MNKNAIQGCFCLKAAFIKKCHSQVFLLGIFRVLSSYVKKGNCLCNNGKYVEDPRLQASGMTANWTTARGFTLIELLVVVLIIGILAAVALPQYQKAVLKSRFTQAKVIANNLATAEELYYLKTGTYTNDGNILDVDVSGCSSSTNSCVFPWGRCTLPVNAAAIECQLYKNGSAYLAYQIWLNHSNTWTERYCKIYTNDINDIGTQICRGETGRNTYSTGGEVNSWIAYRY